MTVNDDNVGFLGTESGVKQFQLSLGGRFVHMQAGLYYQKLHESKT